MPSRRLNSPEALAALAARRYVRDVREGVVVDRQERRRIERLLASVYRAGYCTCARRARKGEDRRG